MVWDAQDSKLLLKISPFWPQMVSATSNGHLFAYHHKNQVFVWMEAPSGYTLHQKLTFSLGASTALYISPNGGSIALSLNSAIHLWHTKDPILLSNPSQTEDHHQHSFILRFSPSQTLAAFWQITKKKVIILGLQAGDPQSIDTGMNILGLGITESTIVIVGRGKIVSWNLSVENARVNINDSAQTTRFITSKIPTSAKVSPDLSQITLWNDGSLVPDSLIDCVLGCSFLMNSKSLIKYPGVDLGTILTQVQPFLDIYDVSTGKCLASCEGVLKFLLLMNSR